MKQELETKDVTNSCVLLVEDLHVMSECKIQGFSWNWESGRLHGRIPSRYYPYRAHLLYLVV